MCEVEQAETRGQLNDSTVIISTDNRSAESALYKVNSSSTKLYNLVVRLKLVEMKYVVNLDVSHVSGKRIQYQGTDAVSRGSLNTGVAAGRDVIEFCP